MSKNKASRKRAEQVEEAAGDVISEVFERADDLVASVAQTASDRLHGIEQQVQQSVERTRSQLNGIGKGLPGGALELATAAARYARRHPWQAAGVCVGTGVIVAALASSRPASTATTRH